MNPDNTESDAYALAQALLRLPPDAINSEVRPIAPEIADILLAHQQQHAKQMAERMLEDITSHANRERTRILTKDQLRLLVFSEDNDIARLAAAELLSREPTSNRTLAHANGDVASIGYSDEGNIYVHAHRVLNATEYWRPATGKA